MTLAVLLHVILGPSLAAIWQARVQRHRPMHHVAQPPGSCHVGCPSGNIWVQRPQRLATYGGYPVCLQRLRNTTLTVAGDTLDDCVMR